MRGSFIQSFTGSLSPISYSSHYFVNFLSLLFSSFILFSSVFLSFVFFHLPSIILSSFHLCSSPSSFLGCRYVHGILLHSTSSNLVLENAQSWGINCGLSDFEYSVNRMNCLHSYGKYPSSGSQFALPSFPIPLLSSSIQTVRRILGLYHAKCWSSSWCLNYSWW